MGLRRSFLYLNMSVSSESFYFLGSVIAKYQQRLLSGPLPNVCQLNTCKFLQTLLVFVPPPFIACREKKKVPIRVQKGQKWGFYKVQGLLECFLWDQETKKYSTLRTMNQLHIHVMWNDDDHTRQNDQDIKQAGSIQWCSDNLLICSLIDKYLIWVVLASFYNIGDCSGDNF